MESDTSILNNELRVVHEDNHLLVILKPQGVLSQGDITGDISIVDIAKKYLKEKYNKQGNVYLGLVHRLDRPTGGLMVLAKTSKAAERLSQAIKDGEIEKKYLCVCEGDLKEKQGNLTHYLEKDEEKNKVKVYEFNKFGTKKAELEYELLAAQKLKLADGIKTISLVEVKLLTGRSHQIRVQFNHIKHPLVCDIKYNKDVSSSREIPATRQANYENADLALWAYKLSFLHPVTKEVLTFISYPNLEASPWKYFDIEDILKYNIREH